MAFSLEEKVDLLLKKVAFGKTKTDTSENTDGFGESIASPLLLRGDKVMKQSGSIPSTPGAVASIVEAYQGTDVVECTAATGTTDTNITGFKRAWSTGHTNWIPSEFSAAYTVEVYVGPTGWDGIDAIATTIGGTNGTSTGANVFRVVPGVETANWFFDYQAGVLYWTNENESGDVGGSTSLTSSIASTDKVYIKGYKYIGAFGVGTDSLSLGTDFDTFAGISGTTLEFDDQTANKVLAGPAAGGGTGAVSMRALVSADIPNNAANTDGVAATATALVAGRTFKVNLSSTSVSTAFNGSANITDIGVANALGVGNGGTGQTTQQAAINALVGGAGSDNQVLLSNGTNVAMGALPAAAVPTLNQNTTGTAANVTGTVLIANGGTSATSAAAARTNLGLEIGTDVQAYDAGLDSIAGLTTAADKMIFTTASDTYSVTGLSSFARTILDDADGAAVRSTIGAGISNFDGDYGSLASTPTLGTMSSQNLGAVDIDGGAIDGTTIGGNAAAPGTFTALVATGAVINGNLTVSGDVIQANSTAVNFEDNVLQLAVPRGADKAITAEDGSSALDSGLDFVKVTSAGSIDEFASMRYDVSADKIKFTRHADAGNWSAAQIISGADNVAALKFNMDNADTVLQTDQADSLVTMPDGQFANAAAARSLGAVAKCQIIITSTSDGSNNFAPDIQGANGYVIKHNLNTQSIYVVAIKDPNGTPTPIFCKYAPIDAISARVTVGVTADNEVYDIIVIG